MTAAVATVRDALGGAVPALEAAGCETPRLDAELMIADALGVDRAAVVADPAMGIEPAAARVISGRIGRRIRREPVAYILGRRGFRRIELEVDSRVLIPRPETELLVEVALELPDGASVHDVGTGSGAVALAIKDERPDLAVAGSDVSPAAVDVARANAAALGLDVRFWVGPGPGASEGGREGGLVGFTSHTGEKVTSPPDLVVANLPYVREDEWAGLEPEITAWEPRDALVSGEDGLDAIRALVAEAPTGQALALEHAPGQAAAVRELLADAETRRDLAGHERVTLGRAP